MKPYYQDEWVKHYCSDALTVLRELESDSIDLLCTDPPYGISFMGKDWDKALPDKQIWAECLRVLKHGAFAFVMSIPRSDCQARMVISLQDVGFRVDFAPIYWAYASGFPKAQNIGKAVDKKLGAEREKTGAIKEHAQKGIAIAEERTAIGAGSFGEARTEEVTKATTPQAKALEGSYGGFQPKPSVEVIIVAMKPLSEKTYVDQALKNKKGITWLDNGRIPYESGDDKDQAIPQGRITTKSGNLAGRSQGGGIDKELDRNEWKEKQSGRFPANLLVSDDVLNDGKVTGGDSRKITRAGNVDDRLYNGGWKSIDTPRPQDSGSFSRYFDLDKWAQKTFPFLIVPKASKGEKNKGLTDGEKNIHPTCKPLKLMSYLIMLGSRSGDTVIDPFGGSGTTALASKLLGRKCIILEIEEKYCEIAANRCRQMVMDLRL